MATWEPVPQAEMEQRPVSRWSDDNDTPMTGTHHLATYIPPYRILERFRGSPVDSRRGSGQDKVKGTAREALEDFLQRIRGWRTGLVLCILVCALMLGLNVATTVLSVLRMNQDGGGDNDVQQLPTGINNQVVTFYQGDCATTRTFAVVLRLVINILATILLAGANYCMQILVSPTRGELDLVHRHKRWLWVGVPNLSNLPHIGLDRAAICLLLIVSTLPLHLLWNAALVETIGADDYYVGGVTEDFFSSTGDANFSTSLEKSIPGWFQGSRKNFDEVWFPAMRGSGLANLTAADCIRAYGSASTGLYGNVALVFGTHNGSNSFLFAGTRLIGTDDEDSASVGFGNSWVCGLPAPTSPACDYHSLADTNSTSWTPLSHAAGWSALESSDSYLATLVQSNVPVKYCMAQPTVAADGSPLPSSSAGSCRLASLPILQYAVLGANALQLLCLVGTWFAVRRRGGGKLEGDERIVTSGDLIASYLRDPDLRFAGRCLASARMVKKARRQRNIHARRRRRGSATTQQAQVDGRDEAAVGQMEEEGTEDEEDINVGFWNSSQPMPLPWNGRARRRTTVLGSHEKAGFTLEPPGSTKARHRLSQLGCFGQPPDEAETRMMEKQGRKSAPRWHTGVPGFFARQLPPVLVVLAILGLFFGFRLQQQDLSLAAGFGQPSLQAIAGFPARLSTSSNWGAAATALVANTPQLLGIYVYLTCNAALTAMLAHAEVSRFAVRRGGLRVSDPRPDTAQRSSFHLHLPLHFSLPLLMGCAALHWLLGESLFLLRVAAYDGLLRPQVQVQVQVPVALSPRTVMTAVGYSAIPILATAGLLALLVGVMLAMGWVRRYMGAERMPLFATCSASLAAATCPTSSFFFPQVVATGSGVGYGGKKTEGGEGGGMMEPTAAQQRSRVGSWVEAVGLTTGSAHGVGLAHGHPSRDELGVLSTPDPIAGSYAYYRVRRFEEKLSEHGLAWGTVDDSEPVHHATFSLGPVLPLEKGQFYA
ncbi:hypothetical protein PG985_006376 [Apiospora marii]|uniref:uncharacterized protein n=1 Tax=Apiospora marii TaxID=335849 RepID=UPI0031326773